MADKIFIAEDDEGIREVYECALSSAGYDLSTYESAEELIQRLESDTPSLIILDIMLPNMDGITALSQIKSNRATENIPIIMISARSEENVVVKGLMNGADDYLTKPFGVMELVARVNNIIKRNKKTDNTLYTYHDMVVDDKKHRVLIGENKLDLSPKEYNIIKLLISRRGEVVTREELFDKVWGEGYGVETRTLDIHINGIRQKIAKVTDDKYVETVRGIGFVIGE